MQIRSARHFISDYEKLTNRLPMPWMVRLYSRLMDGNLPRTISGPTGLGKSQVVVIFTLARAHGAPIPRRLVVIPPLRAIVDQFSADITSLMERLHLVPDVRDALAAQSATSMPLAAATLRGQYQDNHSWLRDPSVTSIIVATPHQFVSGVLAHGYLYGRTRALPVAGLLGTDAWVVFDEAHQQQPAAALARTAISHGADITVTEISATNYTKPDFRLIEKADEDQPSFDVVRNRIHASKRLEMIELGALKKSPKGKHVPKAENAFGDVGSHQWNELWKMAINRMLRQPGPYIIRVDSPGLVAAVAAMIARDYPEILVDVCTGTIRPYERDRKVDESPVYKALLRTGDAVNTVLVTNRAGEVGCDFSARTLMMFPANLHRDVQMIGRLNRLGEYNNATVIYITPKGLGHLPQPAATTAAFKTLDGDVSVAALENAGLSATFPDAVPLPPATRDLAEHDFDSLFLRNFRPSVDIQELIDGRVADGAPTIELVWRTEVNHPMAMKILQDRSAKARERCTAYLYGGFTKFVEKRGGFQAPGIINGELISIDVDVMALSEKRRIPVFCDSTTKKRLSRPDILFLDPILGGLAETGIFDPASTTVVRDVSVESGAGTLHLLDESPAGWTLDDIMAPTFEDAISIFKARCNSSIIYRCDDSTGYVITKECSGSAHAIRPMDLATHLEKNGEWNQRIGIALGMDEDTVLGLRLGGYISDLGKAHPLWQSLLGNPSPEQAKGKFVRSSHTLGGFRHEFHSVTMLETKPKWWSDEIWDLWLGASDNVRDIALFVALVHHGHGLPVFEDRHGDPTMSLQNKEIAIGQMKRYCQLLQTRGRWKTAFLAAVQHAGDVLGSEV